MLDLPHTITAIALLGTGALFGASIYDAVVLAPNLRGGPTGLEHGRLFMSAATPARFFRVLAPAAQILVAISIVVNWSDSSTRGDLGGALLALVFGDVITFKYHYPRNHLMFTAPLEVPADKLNLAARQWASGNLARVALVFIAWVATLTALMSPAA